MQKYAEVQMERNGLETQVTGDVMRSAVQTHPLLG